MTPKVKHSAYRRQESRLAGPVDRMTLEVELIRSGSPADPRVQAERLRREAGL